VAVARYLANGLGMDLFDECSYRPNQLMYWPSCPQNGEFIFKETEKNWLNPDDILTVHPNWKDSTTLPTSSRESQANKITQQKAKDPLKKEGAVGLFNRAFPLYPQQFQNFCLMFISHRQCMEDMISSAVRVRQEW
jgi:hypothetical protein